MRAEPLGISPAPRTRSHLPCATVLPRLEVARQPFRGFKTARATHRAPERGGKALVGPQKEEAKHSYGPRKRRQGTHRAPTRTANMAARTLPPLVTPSPMRELEYQKRSAHMSIIVQNVAPSPSPLDNAPCIAHAPQSTGSQPSPRSPATCAKPRRGPVSQKHPTTEGGRGSQATARGLLRPRPRPHNSSFLMQPRQ